MAAISRVEKIELVLFISGTDISAYVNAYKKLLKFWGKLTQKIRFSLR